MIPMYAHGQTNDTEMWQRRIRWTYGQNSQPDPWNGNVNVPQLAGMQVNSVRNARGIEERLFQAFYGMVGANAAKSIPRLAVVTVNVRQSGRSQRETLMF